jgi:hypothetical protein
LERAGHRYHSRSAWLGRVGGAEPGALPGHVRLRAVGCR